MQAASKLAAGCLKNFCAEFSLDLFHPWLNLSSCNRKSESYREYIGRALFKPDIVISILGERWDVVFAATSASSIQLLPCSRSTTLHLARFSNV